MSIIQFQGKEQEPAQLFEKTGGTTSIPNGCGPTPCRKRVGGHNMFYSNVYNEQSGLIPQVHCECRPIILLKH